jgi:cytochrome oxidase assembly protein ShyY1
MSRYRFALRPRWILSHLFVIALVAAMLWAGLWQLRRLDEKQARNDRVRARAEQPVVPAQSLAEPGEFDAAADLEFRQVTATGRYLPDREVLVRSRSFDGAPGSWVFTPLEVEDGLSVAVIRGWIPNPTLLEEVPEAFRAPEGPVTVTGLVRITETRGNFGPTDPTSGTVSDLARADVARLDAQVPGDLLPFGVQLLDQDPALTAADPTPVPAPAPDEGPHLSYAVQWFIFSTIAVIGYPLILRRRAREVEREERIEALDGPDPDDVPGPGDPRLDHAPGSTST